jgi:hypothetical protein
MNVEIGTEAPIFLFWEYLFQIFGILSLQCVVIVALDKLLMPQGEPWQGEGAEADPEVCHPQQERHRQPGGRHQATLRCGQAR